MASLEQVQHLVDELSPADQVRLLEYLTPRLRAVQSVNATIHLNTWEAFFQIGDAVAALDTPDVETLTAAIAAMRR